MQHSARYVVMFAAAVCVFCSVFVAGSAVLLKDRQEANKALDIQKKELAAGGSAPLRLQRSDCDERIERLVHQLIEKKVRRRPRSAVEVAQHLRAIGGSGAA